VAVWTSAVANGGKVVQPHLAFKLEEPITHNEVLLNFDQREVPVSPENLAVVRQGMRDCVTYGSCQLMKSLFFFRILLFF